MEEYADVSLQRATEQNKKITVCWWSHEEYWNIWFFAKFTSRLEVGDIEPQGFKQQHDTFW